MLIVCADLLGMFDQWSIVQSVLQWSEDVGVHGVCYIVLQECVLKDCLVEFFVDMLFGLLNGLSGLVLKTYELAFISLVSVNCYDGIKFFDCC